MARDSSSSSLSSPLLGIGFGLGVMREGREAAGIGVELVVGVVAVVGIGMGLVEEVGLE